MQIKKLIIILLAGICLQGCVSPKMGEELQQGKATFAAGDYANAFHQLLPIAVSGDKEAQYAVGYMYYNGLGVAQDTQTGIFWMHKSADQKYPPAQNALKALSEPRV